jgi:K+-transporting ATPase ATPase A chain
VGTVLIVGALTFFPAIALGPIVEHYLMQSGKLFSMITALPHALPNIRS